jgi:hypothetical protein
MFWLFNIWALLLRATDCNTVLHGNLRITPQVQFSVCYPPDLMPGATLTFLGGGGFNLTVPWETHLTDPSTAVCLSPSLSTVGAAVNGQDVAFRVSFHETNAGVETAFGTTVEAAGDVPAAVGWVNVLYLDGVPVQSSYMRGPLASGDTAEDTMVWQFGPLGSQPRLLELAVDAYSSVNADMREHNTANNRVGIYVKICDWPPPTPEPPAPVSPPPMPWAPVQPPHAPLSPPLPPVYQCFTSVDGSEYSGDIRHTEGGHRCAHTPDSCCRDTGWWSACDRLTALWAAQVCTLERAAAHWRRRAILRPFPFTTRRSELLP